MTREQEIGILQSLKGDTYFAQHFGADIDTMCENIRKDFAIESGCRFNARAAAEHRAAEEARAAAFEERKLTVEKIVRYAEPEWDSELYHYCASLCGGLFVIETKLRLGLELSDGELYYLVRAARGNRNNG